MYAVQVEDLQTIFFVNKKPRGIYGPIQKNVTLDVPENWDDRHEGLCCPEPVLCVAEDDPGHYRIYRDANEIERGFKTTNMNYGGPYSLFQFEERMRGVLRGKHENRWVAWSEDLRDLVAADDTFEGVRAGVDRAGVKDAVYEWVPPMPTRTIAGQS